jgi:predicted AlkP superfamily pyrophosphatase or phosphodiesterase
MLKATPYGNSLVADFAMAAIDGEQMGQDEVPDFLTVSFSSTDYIGHQYGVNSVEIEDTYLRLDKDIERLLKHLDQEVGDGNYTVFLTADHGAVNVPAYLQSNQFNAGYFDERAFIKHLDSTLAVKFEKENLIKNVSNDQIFLDHTIITDAGINELEVEKFIAYQARNYPGIDKAFTREAMTTSNFDTGVAALVQRGFHHQRSGDVIFLLDPGVIVYGPKGSTHGSAQSYDTHVPFLLYGYGVAPGSTSRPVFITDIAPTIASILQISFPNSATGNPVSEALKK